MTDDLIALSPLDGRYHTETESLRDHFSEFAFIRDRVRVEIDYLIALSRQAQLVRPLTSAEVELLQTLKDSFRPDDALQIKAHEQKTRHDVKAIENFLRDRLASTSMADLASWLHFGLTSEDVNNLAQATALRDSRDRVLLPALDGIIRRLANLAQTYRSTPMLAHTHGQPAVPTTFGKEMAVFVQRLRKQRAVVASHRFEAKLTGAIGNFNAPAAAAPQIDWLGFSQAFIKDLGLEPNLATTQTLPYENWQEYLDALRRSNSVLLDLARDMWLYIGSDYLKLKVVKTEIGSSTMPQKVNPIDFENAEGNLGIANSLLEHFGQKLPISRLQRDLSDSTVRRTFGTALGHSLVAYASLARGLDRIEVNEARMKTDLENHWEVVAEGAQTILRAAGIINAYEQLKSLTRGRQVTEEGYHAWVEALNVDKSVRRKLLALSPLTYTGLAEEIAKQTLQASQDQKE